MVPARTVILLGRLFRRSTGLAGPATRAGWRQARHHRGRAMVLRLLALALCVLLLPAAQADQPTPDTRRPLLWKVSDADNAVYLLGAFHLLKDDDYPLPAEVDRAFDDSASLLFEVDPSAMDSPESVAVMQNYMAYDNGQTLSTVLPRTTWARLATLVAAGGGSVQALEHSEPWAVNLGLVMGVTRAMGFRPELGLDRVLMARARAAGKPAAGLETVEDQVRAMDAVPHTEQVQALDEFLADPQKAVQEMRDIHAWWRMGDVAKLDSKMREEMARKTPESYRLLDVERNRAWLPKIEKRLTDIRKDNTLVVVGALHLLGSDGLVEQLRAKGYTVERICDACAMQ